MTFEDLILRLLWWRQKKQTVMDPRWIAEAKDGGRCPLCSAVKGAGFSSRDGKHIPGGFELIFDESDEFGARCLCHNCGFSF